MSYCILDLYIVCRGVLPPNSFSYLLFWKFLLFWANIQLIFFFEVIESKERACIRNRTSNKLYFYLNNVTFLLAICKHGNMKWLGNKNNNNKHIYQSQCSFKTFDSCIQEKYCAMGSKQIFGISQKNTWRPFVKDNTG